MAWPPVNNSTTGYSVDGVTSIRWGTDGLFPYTNTSGQYYVVLRFDEKELVEVIKLPQGTGLTASRVRIKDGVHYAITVRDDTAWAPPKVGDAVNIWDAAGLINATRAAYSAKIVENDFNTALKQAGERVLVLERLILIEGA